MTDIFHYESPLGILGKLADFLFLKRYLENLLNMRNKVIKDYAENRSGKLNNEVEKRVIKNS